MTSAPNGSLAMCVIGVPPSKPGKTPSNRYLKGETSDVRHLFIKGDWDAGTTKMVANLTRKFKATPEYAAWWVGETVERYKQEGVPPAPVHRGKAGTATPLIAKAAPPAPITLAGVIDMVDRYKGEYSKSSGIYRISFNGTQVFEGALDDQPSIVALHGVVNRLTSLAQSAEGLKSKYAAAAADLLIFLDDHAEGMAQMGLSRDTYVGDASHAKELAVVTKRADDAVRSCETKDSKIAQLEERITDLEAELEMDEEEDEEGDDEEGDEEDEEEEEERPKRKRV